MEKIVEVTEEIEKKGIEILNEAEIKANEIMHLTKIKIEKLKNDEIIKANAEIRELEDNFQKELVSEVNKIITEKNSEIKKILNIDISKINIDEIISKELLEL